MDSRAPPPAPPSSSPPAGGGDESREQPTGRIEALAELPAHDLVTPRTESRLLERGESIGRYVVLKSVGAGGMGTVYAAYDPELDRKVALKLLRMEDSAEGRLRLLREAQAMARVLHPNVCTVFDVGTLGSRIFVAMEFIDGVDLQQWLEQRHPWREVLQVFLQAGQGLAAAHEAGLVHRDFKPANVLVGQGGRACVTDFGLARLVVGGPELEPSVAVPRLPEQDTSTSLSSLSSSVTHEGVVVGTPQYMPPEQYLGQASDARSDQFSFCAALYWALHGERPFEPRQMQQAARVLSQEARGGTGTPLEPLSLEGFVREPPRGSEVPAWVRRAMMRGLSLQPEARFPSMKELLEELAQEPRRVRRRWALGAVGAALSLVAGVSVHVIGQEPVCAGSKPLVASVWNPEAKQKLEAVFAATERPFAAESARAVGQVLDKYAQDWARQHTEACVATRVQGVQTEELLSLRVVCLERRRKDFQALTRLLTEADGKVVERAVDAAHALPALHECQDIESLANQVALPADLARRAEVEQLSARLAEVKALQDAGQYKRALESARSIEPTVEEKGWLPLRAELRSRRGWLQHLLGETQEGARSIELGIRDAEAARADRTKVEALTRLLFVYGVQGQQERAELWAGLASAALERLGGDPLLASDLQGNLGSVALRQSRYVEARTYFEKTRELQQQVLEPGDPRLARTVYNLGMTALFLGEAQRAEELLSEALRQTGEAKGQRHPDMALRHAMLSWAQRENGNYAGALEHARAAVSIRQATFGQEHPAVAEALDAVGMSLIGLKQHDEARKTFEAALAMRQKLLGPRHADLVYSYDGLGRALLEQGRAAEALSPLEKALAFKDVEPETQAEVGFNLARALWESGKDRARARAVARGARERYASLGKQARVKEIDAWLKEVVGRPEP